MPIYTRTGDTGLTSLPGGIQIEKDDPRLEVCGTIDELSASLGVVRAEGVPTRSETILLRIQQELIPFCADIVFADSTCAGIVCDGATISPEHVQRIESDIDLIASELPALTDFIIAGENRSSAMLHLARTICRRAERRLATLCRMKTISPHLAPYLNRLSDLLFVLALTNSRPPAE